MTFFSLLDVDQNKKSSASASDQDEALAVLGKEIGMDLSLKDSEAVVACYLLDEWEAGPHWVDHHIRVFGTPIR
jgi:hypothetical protein